MTIFGDTLREIRTKRRMTVREFSPDASPSLIHDCEQGSVLPSKAKLNQITGCLGQVAIEQGSEYGPDEKLALESAWLQDHFIRLGVPEDIVHTLAAITMLKPEERTEVTNNIMSTLS